MNESNRFARAKVDMTSQRASQGHPNGALSVHTNRHPRGWLAGWTAAATQRTAITQLSHTHTHDTWPSVVGGRTSHGLGAQTRGNWRQTIKSKPQMPEDDCARRRRRRWGVSLLDGPNVTVQCLCVLSARHCTHPVCCPLSVVVCSLALWPVRPVACGSSPPPPFPP